METLGFFARAHEVSLPRLLDEIRREPPPRPHPLPVVDEPLPGDNIYRPFFKSGIAVVLSLGAAWDWKRRNPLCIQYLLKMT